MKSEQVTEQIGQTSTVGEDTTAPHVKGEEVMICETLCNKIQIQGETWFEMPLDMESFSIANSLSVWNLGVNGDKRDVDNSMANFAEQIRTDKRNHVDPKTSKELYLVHCRSKNGCLDQEDKRQKLQMIVESANDYFVELTGKHVEMRIVFNADHKSFLMSEPVDVGQWQKQNN